MSGNPHFREWMSDRGYAPLPGDYDPSSLGIPAYSNSLVAVVPGDSADSLIARMRSSILGEWEIISDAVRYGLDPGVRIDTGAWDRAIRGYWVFRHGVSPWIGSFDDAAVRETAFEGDRVKKISDCIKAISGHESPGAFLYQPSHELSGIRHNADKESKQKVTAQESGMNPEPAALVRQNIPACAGRLPSSLAKAFRVCGNRSRFGGKNLDRYVAIVSMDGDGMGGLMRGSSANFARWRNILHSDLLKQIEAANDGGSHDPWKSFRPFLDEKRHLFPWVHLFMSESLADFSLRGAPAVTARYGGQCLYFGGDDIVAAFPVRGALAAAREIRDLYRTAFAVQKRTGAVEACAGAYRPRSGERLLTHLGKAATMSAAVVFAPEGEADGALLSYSRKVLDDISKDATGRDAVTIVLKRSVGKPAMASNKWETPGGSSFIDILLGRAASSADEEASSDIRTIADFLRDYDSHDHF